MEVKLPFKADDLLGELGLLASIGGGSRAGLESRRNGLERLSLGVSFTPGREAAT